VQGSSTHGLCGPEKGVYTPAGIIAKPAGTLQGFDKD
jgi:hypothetical protein